MKVSFVFIIHSYIAILFKCHQREETTEEPRRTRANPPSSTALTVVVCSPKIKLLSVSRWENSLMSLQERTFKMLLPTERRDSISQNFTSRWTTVCLAPFTPELSVLEVKSLEIGISVILPNSEEQILNQPELVVLPSLLPH